jgi:hypothetical protein
MQRSMAIPGLPYVTNPNANSGAPGFNTSKLDWTRSDDASRAMSLPICLQAMTLLARLTPWLVAAAALPGLVCHPAQGQAPVQGPDTRHGPPSTLEGATVLDTTAAAAAWRGGQAIFVDVMPRPGPLV